LAHCWVLKDQAAGMPPSWGCVGCGESSGLLRWCRTGVWWPGLVGLLFEICIVDASILCDAASGG
jgi:hypothetical protein